MALLFTLHSLSVVLRAGSARRARYAARHAGWLAALLSVTLCAATAFAAAQAPPALDGDPRGGYVRISWPRQGSSFQLQQASHGDFRDAASRYEGPHTSTVISGLTDGRYFYRVRHRLPDGNWSAWSQSAEFHVRHHSLLLAGSLFGLGAVVFGATALFVLRAKDEV